nr:MAG TPA: YjeJ-like protein [Caudoviricetes sp.]
MHLENFIEIAEILIDFLPLCDVSYNEGGRLK